MGRGDREDFGSEAERGAEDAREAWRRARDEMRDAAKRTREARHKARERGEPYREEDVEALREVLETAREFAREIGDETRHLAHDAWRSAKEEWKARWRERWVEMFGNGMQEHWVFGGRRFRQWATGGEESNPFVAAFLSRGGGLLALYALHLLAEQPRHGNDIMRQIELRTQGSWTSNPGAIYPLLSFMEEKGLVQSKWEDPDKRTRRIYHLTDEGTQELDRLRRVLRPKVMEAIEVLHQLYNDLYETDTKSEPPPAGGAATSQDEPSRAHGSPEAPDAGDLTTESSMTDAEPPSWRDILNRLFRKGPDAQASLGA